MSSNESVLHGAVYFMLGHYTHRSLHLEVDKGSGGTNKICENSSVDCGKLRGRKWM